MKDHWLTLVSSPSLIPDDPKYVPQAIYFGKNHKLKNKNAIICLTKYKNYGIIQTKG